MDKRDIAILAQIDMITKMAQDRAVKMATNLGPGMYRCKLQNGEIQFIYVR